MIQTEKNNINERLSKLEKQVSELKKQTNCLIEILKSVSSVLPTDETDERDD